MERRLSAIVSIDVVGYSRLMGASEVGTLARLNEHRAELIDPTIAEHNGRIVKLTGDGLLVEFSSVVRAVECAAHIQRTMHDRNVGISEDRRIEFRIGVNLGDVIVENGDLFGDGINVAARIEGIAKPGGVAVSGSVRDNVGNKLDLDFQDTGEHILKNIAQPVRVYNLALDPDERSGGASQGAARTTASEKPSIAVLPFANMSGEPEQEYFSDGISEDIITDLSKVSALSVIARNSAFVFKGSAVDVLSVARKLKVSHVLEGSVRKSGGRVRITAQLIDGAAGDHIWAERYDRDLTDVFAIQDEISEAIVRALKLKLLPEEKQAIENRGTASAEAYDLYLMARQYWITGNHGDRRREELVVRICRRATEIDPDYARAWALMAIAQSNLRYAFGGGGDEADDGVAAAERALALDPDIAEAHCPKARHLAEQERFEEADTEIATALRLDPDSWEVNKEAGRMLLRQRRIDEATRHFEKAVAVMETDFHAWGLLFSCYQAQGRSDEAIRVSKMVLKQAERVLAQDPDNGSALSLGATSLAVLGQAERAKQWLERALLVDPDNLNIRYNFVCNLLVHFHDTDAALDMLEPVLAVAAKPMIELVEGDVDLDSLRDEPRFQAMLAAAKKRVEDRPRD